MRFLNYWELNESISVEEQVKISQKLMSLS
jgi:hypothetical protein